MAIKETIHANGFDISIYKTIFKMNSFLLLILQNIRVMHRMMLLRIGCALGIQ